ncbi:F-box/kelch-repeat protein At3g23880-like [Cornus florida]|uniref:F-box/kelch-repeat protein At3g23880-like n=1 Tax=Cornus florida TaxID=4283 RepID=UPI00289A7494|nr:F-box/kelch-repeat protein At3g23880-like [Cornus florida]XP_059652741.1 F-box/kelch-repeat protein At3g23880-like [Cornus florida]
MASCNKIFLPEDVMIEILSRLPVKSVIRAGAVCKNWYSIIKNPSLVTKHLNNHHTNNNNSGRLFISRRNKVNIYFSLFPDETLACTYEDVVVVLDIPNCVVVVASPYNGILCLCTNCHRSNRFALWNPAIREFRSLPVLPRNHPPNVKTWTETFGFGLDPITNDYKVVWIWNTTKEDAPYRFGPFQVAVYTLSTDSWRYLDHVALPYHGIDTPLSNTCINGVYHWLATQNCEDSYSILSFDMGNELFHDIPVDIPTSKHYYSPPRLLSYNNSLALICYDYSNLTIDIWVMMEDDGCWTKHFTVEMNTKFWWCLGFWRNNQLIIQTDVDGHVALYDPHTCEIKDFGSKNWYASFVYRDSLVAIRGKDGFLKQDYLSDADQICNFSKTVEVERSDFPDDEDFDIFRLFLI